MSPSQGMKEFRAVPENTYYYTPYCVGEYSNTIINMVKIFIFIAFVNKNVTVIKPYG